MVDTGLSQSLLGEWRVQSAGTNSHGPRSQTRSFESGGAPHQILAESRHLIATTARMRRILTEPPDRTEGRPARDIGLSKDSSASR